MVLGTERERKHALLDGPWRFFDNLMVFKEPKGMETPTEVQFEEFTTWIQCHNLPLACMNPKIGRRIGESVGKVEEIDTGTGGNCIGQYARLRVTREISKPLQRCVVIKTDDGNMPHTILIRYERLPVFCQACSRIGHISRHCEDPEVDKSKIAYGQWLKAARAMEYRRNNGPAKPQEGSGTSPQEKSEERAIVMAERQHTPDRQAIRERDVQGEGKTDNRRRNKKDEEETQSITDAKDSEEVISMEIVAAMETDDQGAITDGTNEMGKTSRPPGYDEAIATYNII